MPVSRCDQSIRSVVDVIESIISRNITCTQPDVIQAIVRSHMYKLVTTVLCSWHYKVWHGHSQRHVHWSTMPRWNTQLAGWHAKYTLQAVVKRNKYKYKRPIMNKSSRWKYRQLQKGVLSVTNDTSVVVHCESKTGDHCEVPDICLTFPCTPPNGIHCILNRLALVTARQDSTVQ